MNILWALTIFSSDSALILYSLILDGKQMVAEFRIGLGGSGKRRGDDWPDS